MWVIICLMAGDDAEQNKFSAKDFKDVPPEYSPFNPNLDEDFPVDQLFTPENAAIATSTEMEASGWVSLFRMSPARNNEAETMMGDFVRAALNAGQWVDIQIRPDEPMVKDAEVAPGVTADFSAHQFEFQKGGRIMEEKGLIKTVQDDDGHNWARPTAELIKFIWERTQNLSPRAEK